MKLFKIASLGFVASLAFAMPAQAGSVTCPNPDVGRDFTLTTSPGTATCFAHGDTNIGGSNSDFAGYTVIDKDESPDAAFPNDAWLTVSQFEATGTITISAEAWATYGSLVLLLKTGSNATPVWAAFLLPLNETSATFSISDPVNGLSHAILYGSGTPTGCTEEDCNVVPEPGTMLMLGTGLALLAARLRRRKA